MSHVSQNVVTGRDHYALWKGRMYVKIFASLFEGSFYGAGPVRYAVWVYLLSKANPDGIVSCNSKAVSAAIGCSENDVVEALEWLQSPDPVSRNPAHEGRRIEAVTPYEFFILNYAHYRDLKTREMEREGARERQRRCRSQMSQMSQQKEKELQEEESKSQIQILAESVIDAYNETFGTALRKGAGNIKAARRALDEGYTLEVLRSVFEAVRDRSTITAKWCWENNREFEYLTRPTYKNRQTKEPMMGPLDRIPNELQTGRV